MKKKPLSVLLAVLFVALFSAGQAYALAIGPILSDSDITVGDAFTIEVWANDAFVENNKVLAFGFDITNSTPSVAKYDSYEIGSLFTDDSARFPDTDVAGHAFPGIAADSILLATLSFTAIGVGNAEFGIYSDITGHNEGLIYSSGNHVDITSDIDPPVTGTNDPGVTDANGMGVTTNVPVPEPVTMLLLGTGLIGLLGFRKRFRGI